MSNFGEAIRKLREDRKLTLRVVSDSLGIDQAILSKIERGQRKANRVLVTQLAEFYRSDNEELMVAWLADKIIYELSDESLALQALQVAEAKVKYAIFSKVDRQMLLSSIAQELRQFLKIKKAWIFGSFSREDDHPDSDIDLAIDADRGFSYFDLAEVQHVLEKRLNRKVDIGFIDSFKSHIARNVQGDLKVIYER
jgi:predicted nucleotidyltransferase